MPKWWLSVISVVLLTIRLSALELLEGKDGIGVPIGSYPVSSAIPLDTLVLQSFENWRKVMLKGNSQGGIPLLDPFVFPFDIFLKFPHPVNPALGYYEILLNKLTFTGLTTFKVKSLQVDPLSRDMSFENYVGNMSASTNYILKYYFANIFQVPVAISEGSAYGAIYGADLLGTGNVLPTPGNWFKLARISMTFSFESLDIRIYPKVPFGDATLQKNVQDAVYNEIQRLKPNMSQLSTTTYSKTVELNLS